MLANSSPQIFHIWQHLLNHVKLEISEWSLWIIFLGLTKERFFEMLFANISSQSRLLLLDIVFEYIENEYKNSNSNVAFSNMNFPEDYQSINDLTNRKILPNDCISFMVDLVKCEIYSFLSLASLGNTQTCEEDTIRLLCKLCSLLLKLTLIEDCRQVIQQDQ